jgi:protein disulfide-isomerase A6
MSSSDTIADYAGFFFRLKSIASKADLKKQDEIKIKDNILRAFQTEDARDKHDL